MTYWEGLARDSSGGTPEVAVDVEFVPTIESAAPLASHRADLRALFLEVRAIEVNRFESASEVTLCEDLKPRTTQILAKAIVILGELVEACESSVFDEEPPSGGFPIPFDDGGSLFESGVGDVAFMAQVELRHRADRLSRIIVGDVLLAECDGALRRVARALTALDRAIARANGARESLTFDANLDLSLSIRRAYGQFRRRIVQIEHSTAAGRERLLGSGREIATLVGLPFYTQLRLGDRLHLRSLQQRLITALRAAPIDELEAYRLWSDILSFALMLTQVNRRQELFEHDSRIVIRAVESLTKHGELSVDLARELTKLEGRDDDVDLICATNRRDLETWAPVLTRLAHELGRSRAEDDR